MKILTHISRFLLGFVFLVFGLNEFLHFIPRPPPSGFWGVVFASARSAFDGIFQARVETKTSEARGQAPVMSPA
jgi:hypothetical protein